MTALARGLLLAAIAWGAFAFGAVYPWAYWPLMVTIQGVALIGLLVPGQHRPLGLTRLAAGLAVFVGLAVLQLVPLPLHWVRAVSPNAIDALGQLEPSVANGLASAHPLSLSPGDTLTGVAIFGSLAFTIVGAARLLSMGGAREFVERIVLIGVALALTGIIQQPLYHGRIYGFWRPLMGGNPFGPFVNKNHFAGWMLMGIPLTIGLICAGIARGVPPHIATWRDRLVWAGTPEASRLVLLFGAAGLMMLSLLFTMARSGLMALLVALAITTALVAKRQPTRTRALVIASSLMVLLASGIAWFGVSSLASRFANAEWAGLGGRLGVWTDAVAIAGRFWTVGTGLNTYGVATTLYQTFDLLQHYEQAHNDYLQLAVEGGLLLGIPAIICLILFVGTVRRRFREETSVTAYWLRAGAVTGLTAVMLQDAVEFSLQMPGNAVLFAVLCAIALHRAPERKTRPTLA